MIERERGDVGRGSDGCRVGAWGKAGDGGTPRPSLLQKFIGRANSSQNQLQFEEAVQTHEYGNCLGESAGREIS